MLVKAGQLDRLQRYIEAGSDRGLLAWWACFQECQGNLQAALEVHSPKTFQTLATVYFCPEKHAVLCAFYASACAAPKQRHPPGQGCPTLFSETDKDRTSGRHLTLTPFPAAAVRAGGGRPGARAHALRGRGPRERRAGGCRAGRGPGRRAAPRAPGQRLRWTPHVPCNPEPHSMQGPCMVSLERQQAQQALCARTQDHIAEA